MAQAKILNYLTNANNRIEIYEMRLQAILDRTQRVIERGDARMADLARFLGKNWNQCHEWLIKRNHLPNAEVALGMMHFIAIYDKSGGRDVRFSDNQKIMVDGRELTEWESDLWIENQMLKTMIASQVGKHDKE
jgi:hypothetical protein